MEFPLRNQQFPFIMPMPKFAIAAPGSMASQRVTRLEKENKDLRQEVADLRAQLAQLSVKDDSDTLPNVEYHMVRVPKPPCRHFHCNFCKEWGHTVDQCVPRFIYAIEKMHTHCQKGIHSPYQHDRDWRCNWCGKHLKDQEVMSFPGWERRIKNATREWEKAAVRDAGKGK